MKYQIKNTSKKGKGVFATKMIKEKERILTVNLTKKKIYYIKDFSKISKKDRNHLDPIGNKKYVVDYSAFSYVNHSCNPNAYVKEKNRKIRLLIALKDINKKEEITYDYTITADPTEHWKEKCYCNDPTCRKLIDVNYYNLSKELQQKYWNLLPIWKKRLIK